MKSGNFLDEILWTHKNQLSKERSEGGVLKRGGTGVKAQRWGKCAHSQKLKMLVWLTPKAEERQQG